MSGEGESNGALWVGIDKQGVETSACESVGEVDSEGGFTHASFLAGDGDADHAAKRDFFLGPDYREEWIAKVFSSTLAKCQIIGKMRFPGVGERQIRRE